MSNAFKVGDIVQLKSGGPAMTVDAVPGERILPRSSIDMRVRSDYHCEWFKGATAARGDYNEHLLQAFQPPQK